MDPAAMQALSLKDQTPEDVYRRLVSLAQSIPYPISDSGRQMKHNINIQMDEAIRNCIPKKFRGAKYKGCDRINEHVFSVTYACLKTGKRFKIERYARLGKKAVYECDEDNHSLILSPDQSDIALFHPLPVNP